MKLLKIMVVALIPIFLLVQGGVAMSADAKTGKKDTKPKQQQSMKEDFKDIGRAVKKDSKTAGHEIKDGFKDIGSEVKGMFKKSP
jgi:D-serine dehydratase